MEEAKGKSCSMPWCKRQHHRFLIETLYIFGAHHISIDPRRGEQNINFPLIIRLKPGIEWKVFLATAQKTQHPKPQTDNVGQKHEKKNLEAQSKKINKIAFLARSDADATIAMKEEYWKNIFINSRSTHERRKSQPMTSEKGCKNRIRGWLNVASQEIWKLLKSINQVN